MNKKILLFAPKTFGFYQHIIDALQAEGFDVVFFDELFTEKLRFFKKVLLKLPLSVKVKLQKWYVSSLVKELQCDFSYIFIIRGEYFSPEVLKIIENRFPVSKRIMYQWDSSRNLHFFEKQIFWFHRIFTFDRTDADKFGLRHKCLFFNGFHVNARSESIAPGKLSFIGTHHSNRLSFIRQFLSENPRFIDKADIKLYRPFSSIFRALLFNKSELEGGKIRDFVAEPISELEVIGTLSSSEFILDITQPGQVGLTIRTFEALGLGRKLVTTNADVKKYDFYDPANILVISDNDLTVPEEFIVQPYRPVPAEVLNRYFVKFWVREFFDDSH
ncbi:hypothetical protein [Marinobacter sp.]|uniref:hypothetical protein n=1 Tax=Marinobacter sp. TaxID=50741 RepID=UPI0035C67078